MNTTMFLRRCFCCFSTSSPPPQSFTKKPIVFLGSPQVSANVLDSLFNASESPDSLFQVAAIVTQPPSQRDRGRKLMPSPVAQFALDRGFSPDLIFTPHRANEELFLASLRDLEPELCVTAAYGNILPTKFLKIPSQGTVNIHPSLLPLYRGAAPVQRALQDGVKETGVSLAYTIRALDAGPVIASERISVDDDIKAADLLDLLFGLAKVKAQPQDDSKATLAPKISPEESWLSFDEEASAIHNKVRAFAGWPGTRARVQILDAMNTVKNSLELKVITTRVSGSRSTSDSNADDVTFSKGALIFPCAGGTSLEVLEVQLPGKKVVNAAAFWNGLRGQKVKKCVAHEAATS